MVDRFDSVDRNILEFRPKIDFVEPDQQPGVNEGVDSLQFEDVQESRLKIKKLAQAVNTLATAVQARVDQKANGIVIELDKNADQDAIQAIRRRFPDQDPYKITYEQYRECKNGIRSKGESIAKQALITPDDIKKARDNLASKKYTPGGYKTNEGSLRPELDHNAQIIQPINVEKMQIDLICILVNFIWKNFIKKTVINASPPVSWAFQGLPDELCNPGMNFEIPGLLILGNQPDDLLTGKVAAEKSAKVLETKV